MLASRLVARRFAATSSKPASERTFKEAYLSDPATYPIIAIISGADFSPRQKSTPCCPVATGEPSRRGRPTQHSDRKLGESSARLPSSAKRVDTGALVFCTTVGLRCLFTNPDVRINKTKRSQIIRTLFFSSFTRAHR